MEKPILFNTEMVQAILEGRKTQTRRIIKPQPKQLISFGFVIASTEKKDEGCFGWGKDQYGGIIDYARPPYKIDDVLWVRETWCKADDGYYYKVDSTPDSERVRKDYGYKWRPSIHMPRVAARIFLKVMNVRVQRIQDITKDEAIKEGINIGHIDNELYSKSTAYKLLTENLPVAKFTDLWNGIYEKQGFGWNVNPWVWVIEFERLEGEYDQL